MLRIKVTLFSLYIIEFRGQVISSKCIDVHTHYMTLWHIKVFCVFTWVLLCQEKAPTGLKSVYMHKFTVKLKSLILIPCMCAPPACDDHCPSCFCDDWTVWLQSEAWLMIHLLIDSYFWSRMARQNTVLAYRIKSCCSFKYRQLLLLSLKELFIFALNSIWIWFHIETVLAWAYLDIDQQTLLLPCYCLI